MAEDDYSPVYLLALDGGGVRGICELVTLHEIMLGVQKAKNLTDLPRPCDYFHLMAGTSTGGLIAILLSRFRMTTQEAIDVYYEFSCRIFSRKNEQIWWGRLLGLHEFGPKALEEIIKELIDSRKSGELMLDAEPSHRSKAFVCSQKAYDQGIPVRFRTYTPPTSMRDVSSRITSQTSSHPASTSSSSSSDSMNKSHAIIMPRNGDMAPTSSNSDDFWNNCTDIKIYEAARATTAAPLYLSPIEITRGSMTETFIDGAMGCNNPADELVDEATALYGADRAIGCLVSLGTGSMGPLTTGKRTGPRRLVDLIKNVKRLVTSPERVHVGLRNQIRPDFETYFRFQLPTGAENIGLHEYKRLDELVRLTELYIKQEEVSLEIDKVVNILTSKTRYQGITLGLIARYDYRQVCSLKGDMLYELFIHHQLQRRTAMMDSLVLEQVDVPFFRIPRPLHTIGSYILHVFRGGGFLNEDMINLALQKVIATRIGHSNIGRTLQQ
ncbi:acyl transferase/acyl hydrolase/lysophospholipase [Annulohypoxylon nitens]|nr:acyl transferase/acyl hydrolase/lysophospholipase [Annulohypoxylon nitens]